MPKQAPETELATLYRRRFGTADRERKRALWQVLCRNFLQRYIDPSDVVVDLGAGYGEFINNIRCGKKYAVDLNADTADHVDADVTYLGTSATNLAGLDDASVDVVFASNFFEHVAAKDELRTIFAEIARVLRPGGRLLVLQPNIRYAFREYWDFFDHHIPLSDRSLTEGLETSGFSVTECRPRFLPYTTRSRLPQSPLALRIYLRLRPMQWLFGKQLFLVAVREDPVSKAPG